MGSHALALSGDRADHRVDSVGQPDSGSRRARSRDREDPRRPHALSSVRPVVQAGDQVFISGINGSGKSRLATRIANALDRVLIYDPKGGDPEVIIPNSVRAWGVRDALRALPGRVVYHPVAAEMNDLPGAFDELVAKIWKIGGGHGIVVHETCDLMKPDHKFAPWLSLACRQGRIRGVTRVFVSQRPVSDVPRLAISESKHYAAFFLQDDDDRRRLAAYMGPEVIERTDFGFDYWYCGRESGMRAVRCAAIA